MMFWNSLTTSLYASAVLWNRDVCRFVALLLIISCCGSVSAQSRDKDRDRKDGPTEQELASRVSKAEEALLKEYMDVVNEYYKKGEKEAAIQVLQRVSTINPKMENVKSRIAEISEELLQENGIKLSIDVSKGWAPVCEVEEGKPFRLQAAGEYKLDYTTMVPLTGLATADPKTDHVASAPFGALIGLIMTDGKPGDPFVVNATLEHTPKQGGNLFLRVNVPATAKCKGDIKLQVSGGVKAIGKKR
jgi:hypothetical protein